MENILIADNLSKKYEGFTLDKVSFQLPKGSIMGLVGENGAGKTTIIKLILNLIKRDAGSIQVLGLDNINSDPKIKNRIGVVLDESNFHDNLKPTDISIVMKNIYDNWDKEKFMNYLDSS